MSSERYGFEYAVLRVVPRVDRGEMINAGVLLYCRPRRYLAARVALDSRRVLAIDPAADVASIERALAAVLQVCEQRPAPGPAGQQDIRRRFPRLTPPRSTHVPLGPRVPRGPPGQQGPVSPAHPPPQPPRAAQPP